MSDRFGMGLPAPGLPLALLGVPFDNVTGGETVALVEGMVASRRPHYLVTANVDFLVQALHDVELRRILFEAHLVLCDGTPLLWASGWLGNPLKERVAGSDLVPLLIRTAAQKGFRLFFLGGSPRVTQDAVTNLEKRYPDLIIAGHYSPPYQPLLEMDHEEIKQRIQAAQPDLLFVSFGCPKQEKWIAMHYRSLQVPVSIGVGATIDFLAGHRARAPEWMQRAGTEWLFRLAQEPKRLIRRYARDCWYFGGLVAAQWWRTHFRSRRRGRSERDGVCRDRGPCREIWCPEWLDADAVQRGATVWEQALAGEGHVLVRLDRVEFIDSTGVGLLIRLRKQAARREHEVVLIGATPPVRRCLNAMRLWQFFQVAASPAEAISLLEGLAQARPAWVKTEPSAASPTLFWRGEVTAANADQVRQQTDAYFLAHARSSPSLSIDLSGVRFIDSTGLGLLVRAKKQAATLAARLFLVGVQSDVINVIRLSRLEGYLLGESGSCQMPGKTSC